MHKVHGTLIHLLIHSFTNTISPSLTYSLSHSLAQSFVHYFIHSFIQNSFINFFYVYIQTFIRVYASSLNSGYSQIHKTLSFIYYFIFIQLLVHSFYQSLTHSLPLKHFIGCWFELLFLFTLLDSLSVFSSTYLFVSFCNRTCDLWQAGLLTSYLWHTPFYLSNILWSFRCDDKIPQSVDGLGD